MAGTLRRTEATESGITLPEAILGFCSGNVELLPIHAEEVIQHAEEISGEIWPWTEDATEEVMHYLSTGQKSPTR